jgi:hypothetical protein
MSIVHVFMSAAVYYIRQLKVVLTIVNADLDF